MQYRSSGIILRNFNLGESDRALKILSPDYGLVTAIAKGARKANSSFSAKTQAMNHCDFLLGKGKNFDVVSEVSIIRNFNLAKIDLLSLNLACLATEISEKVSEEVDSSEIFFDLLDIYLNYLNKLNENSSSETLDNQVLLLSIEFIWCIICNLGYKPDLDNCALTQRRRAASQIPQYFDLNNGSICSIEGYKQYREGYHTDDYVIPLKKFSFKLLKALDASPLSSLETDFQLNLEFNSLEARKPSAKNFREVLIEDFLVNYLKILLKELKETEISLFEINLELKSCLQLLYKHLEFRIHKECKSWKNLSEILYC